MFFLVRMAFWLTIVLALLPSGGSQPSTVNLDVADAAVAAGAAVSDVSSFCDRQPEACKVGAQAAMTIGQRAQAGAAMVFDFISERMAKHDGAAPSDTRLASMKQAHPESQSTLRPSDLDPAWKGTVSHKEAVPLPRPRAKQQPA